VTGDEQATLWIIAKTRLFSLNTKRRGRGTFDLLPVLSSHCFDPRNVSAGEVSCLFGFWQGVPRKGPQAVAPKLATKFIDLIF
jgi:hypothetical protein